MASAGRPSLELQSRSPTVRTADKILVALPRGSVISGRVSDEFGEPVANAVVSAMRYGYAAGARRLMPAPGQNSRDTTDDQGQFRLFGLPPGEYIVSATLRALAGRGDRSSAENTGYAPTYYPGHTKRRRRTTRHGGACRRNKAA